MKRRSLFSRLLKISLEQPPGPPASEVSPDAEVTIRASDERIDPGSLVMVQWLPDPDGGHAWTALPAARPQE
jgi:hypothetical protein